MVWFIPSNSKIFEKYKPKIKIIERTKLFEKYSDLLFIIKNFSLQKVDMFLLKKTSLMLKKLKIFTLNK